jgi:arylsulfatase A-like enzyme
VRRCPSALRDETLARQQDLGVVPTDAELTARPAEIPAWEEMPAGLRPVLARQMEVYAGFLEHTDHHIGRLVGALEDLDLLAPLRLIISLNVPLFVPSALAPLSPMTSEARVLC